MCGLTLTLTPRLTPWLSSLLALTLPPTLTALGGEEFTKIVSWVSEDFIEITKNKQAASQAFLLSTNGSSPYASLANPKAVYR